MKLSGRKLALPVVWVLVCAAGMWYVLRQVPWHDYARLADGRRLAVVEYHYADDAETLVALTVREPDGGELRIGVDLLERAGGSVDAPMIDQGLGRVGQRIDWKLALVGLAVFAPVVWLLGLRLKWMAGMQGIELTWLRASLITYVGNFLNFFLVGLTGGDVVKAVAVARRTALKHEAVTAVFLDRFLGLGCMILLAGVMVVVGWRDPSLTGLGRHIGIMVLVCVAMAGAYFSRTLRRWLGVGRLVSILPLGGHLRRIDRAVWVFGRAKRQIAMCAALTVVIQILSILSVFIMGRSLGMGGSLVAYLVYVSLGWIIAAVPISFQGLGVMEAAYLQLFVGSGLAVGWQAFALAMMARLVQVFWSLPGLPLVPVALAGVPLRKAATSDQGEA